MAAFSQNLLGKVFIGRSSILFGDTLESYDVVIIGSGIGGLTCGALLSKKGFHVLVAEKHSTPGGYCTSFRRKEFVFDSAVHFSEGLGEGGTFYTILKELKVENKVEFYRLDPLYKAIFGEDSFSVPADLKGYMTMLSDEFPQEEGIYTLFETIKKLDQEINDLPAVLETWGKMLVPLKFPTVFKYYKKPFGDMMADCIQDKRLQSVISAGWPYMGLPPSRVSALQMAEHLYIAHVEGHYYPRGGTQVLADTLVNALKNYGGELELNTRVKRILVENKRAVGIETDKKMHATYVVSNADARQTFLNLVGSEKIPGTLLNQLNSMQPSISFFQVWLGIDIDLKDAKEHEIFLYPGYDCDYVYESALEGIIGRGCGICIPTLADPGLSPENYHIVSIIYPVPYSYKNTWETKNNKRGAPYKALKEEVKQKLIKTAEKVIPGLSDHIIVSEAATPVTLQRYTLNWKGAAYGWDQTPDQSSTNRLQPKTPVKNLYLAGHWTTPGGGTVAVATSGKNTAEMIIHNR